MLIHKPCPGWFINFLGKCWFLIFHPKELHAGHAVEFKLFQVIHNSKNQFKIVRHVQQIDRFAVLINDVGQDWWTLKKKKKKKKRKRKRRRLVNWTLNAWTPKLTALAILDFVFCQSVTMQYLCQLPTK